MMHQFYKFIFILPISILFIAIACQNKTIPTHTFKHENVTFELPEDWKNSAQDSSEEQYYLATFDPVSNQRRKFALLEWNRGLISLDTAMNVARSGFIDEPVFQQLNIQFSEVEDTTFAGQDCLKSQFKYEEVGVKYEGKIYSFQLPEANKTLILTVQYAKIDEADVQSIIQSLDKTIQAVPIS